MKLSSLKKKFSSDVAFFAVVIGIMMFANFLLMLKEAGYKNDYQRLKNEIATLDIDYKKTRSTLDSAREMYNTYKAIRPDRIASSTAAPDLPSLIREARDPLQKLKEKYRLIQLDMSLTVPSEMKGTAFTREGVSSISSKVTLKFSGITDELVLSFIKGLIDEFPGYVRINSLDIDREKNIDDQVLAAARNGTPPSLVKGTVFFDWIKLKENTPKPPENDASLKEVPKKTP